MLALTASHDAKVDRLKESVVRTRAEMRPAAGCSPWARSCTKPPVGELSLGRTAAAVTTQSQGAAAPLDAHDLRGVGTE